MVLPAGAAAAGTPLKPDGRHTARAPEPARGPKAAEDAAPVQVPLGVRDPEGLRREKQQAAQGTRSPAGDQAGRLPAAPEDGAGGGPAGVAVSPGLNQPGLGPTGSSPPDTTGAAGPSHYVEIVNTSIAVYDKANLSQVGSISSLKNFVQRPTGTETLFDPQIIWDPQTSRWYYAMVRFEGSAPSQVGHLVFGWSKTADPTDLANGWCHQDISTGGEFDDYPKLGDNDSHLVIGTNFFGINDRLFRTSRVLTVPKPANGDTTCPGSVSGIQSFGTAASPLKTADNANAFTPVPANTIDSSASGYIVSRNGSGSVMAWHADPTGALVPDGNVSVGGFGAPPNVPQPNAGCAGTCDTLDTLDARLTQAVSHKDPDAAGAQAVWTQHTIADPAGTGRAVVRWYELLPGCVGGPCPPGSARRQQGEIKDPSHHVFNAAIAPTTSGNEAVVNYNVGSGALTAEIRARSRLASTALSAMGAEVTLGTSAGSLDDQTCGLRDATPACRWGDYAGATPDPSSAHVVWGSNQSIGPVTPGAPHWQTRNFALAAVPAPALVHEATAVADPSPGGDGDGAVEPGETFNLDETLRNLGEVGATGVNGTLSSSTTGVTVPQPSSPYPDIAVGATGTNTAPFQVAVPGSFTCRRPLNLVLAVTTAQGSFIVPVTVPTGQGSTCPNAPPTSSFTVSPNPAQREQLVSFNGTASADPDGTIAKYEWDLDGDGSFERDTGPTPTAAAVYSSAGTRSVKLRVTDNEGATTESTRSLRINAGPVSSFAVSPNPAFAGQDVSFDGSGSSDADGTITKYEWDLDGDGSFETNTGATASTSRSYSAPGTLAVSLRVTDSDGSKETRAVALTVSAPAVAPGGGGGPAPPVPLPGVPPPPASTADGLVACAASVTVAKDGTVKLCDATNPPTASTTQTLTGRLPARLGGRVAQRRRRKPVVLGRGQTAIPAGQTRPVVAKLGAAAKRALARRGRLAVVAVIEAVGADGQEATVTRAVSLRAGKKRRRAR